MEPFAFFFKSASLATNDLKRLSVRHSWRKEVFVPYRYTVKSHETLVPSNKGCMVMDGSQSDRTSIAHGTNTSYVSASVRQPQLAATAVAAAAVAAVINHVVYAFAPFVLSEHSRKTFSFTYYI